jgi:hypothetical protein
MAEIYSHESNVHIIPLKIAFITNKIFLLQFYCAILHMFLIYNNH